MSRTLILLSLLAGAASPLAAADMASPSFAEQAMDIPLESVMALDAERKIAIVKAAQTLRTGTILTAADLVIETGDASALDAYLGKELKRTIYPGKTLSPNDVSMPTMIQRNALVQVEFHRGPLLITTEGRALDAGAVGDAVRVMNLNSKIVLTAVVTGPNKAATR
ncbi:MAG: flagellar basal body P-ring formation chaperone FlgA [Parvularculaceae bacterium]